MLAADSFPTEQITIMVIIFVPTIAGIWRSATLRADINERWSTRVRLLEAGLSEAAANTLLQIRRQIDDFFGADSEFDPSTVVADPARLRSSVAWFHKCLRIRDRLRALFKTLLLIGPFLTVFLIVLAASELLYSMELLGLYDFDLVATAAVATGVSAAAASLICLLTYVITHHLLSSAEVLAESLNE